MAEREITIEIQVEGICCRLRQGSNSAGTDMLGWTLDELIQQTVDALKTFQE